MANSVLGPNGATAKKNTRNSTSRLLLCRSQSAVVGTSSWDNYRTFMVTRLKLVKGTNGLSLRALAVSDGSPMNLRCVRPVPASDYVGFGIPSSLCICLFRHASVRCWQAAARPPGR